MTYGITLIDAEVVDELHGRMRLGVEHESGRTAELFYEWDEAHFTGTFYGNAPRLPRPAHPVVILEKAIAAIRSQMTAHHRFPTDVFKDRRVSIEIS